MKLKAKKKCICLTRKSVYPNENSTYVIMQGILQIRYKTETNDLGFALRINFCPFCGRNLEEDRLWM